MALEVVQPRTGLAGQKKRCRDSWQRWSHKSNPGRPTIANEVQALIRDMGRCNPLWGSPRLVGELQKLGILGTKSTVETYRPRVRKPPSPGWKALLANHRKDSVACDFFTVPTAHFRVLLVFISLAHARRPIGHFNVTAHPTAQGTAPQRGEACPWDTTPRYRLRDREAIYGSPCQSRVKNLGMKAITTAPRSPWQNPSCERVSGRIRRDVLAQVSVLKERRLQRVLTAYSADYHRFRPPLSLEMDCPSPRAVAPIEIGPVKARPEVGGLQHPYERQAA